MRIIERLLRRQGKIDKERVKEITRNWNVFEKALQEPDKETAFAAAMVVAGISAIVWRPFHRLFCSTVWADEKEAVRQKEKLETALKMLGYKKSEVYYWFSGEEEEEEKEEIVFDEKLSRKVIKELEEHGLEDERKKAIIEGMKSLTTGKRNLMLFSEAIFIDLGVQLKLQLFKEAMRFVKDVTVPELKRLLEEKKRFKPDDEQLLIKAFKIAEEKLGVLLKYKEKLEKIWEKEKIAEKFKLNLAGIAATTRLEFSTKKEFEKYLSEHQKDLVLNVVAQEVEKL